ncbi:MAG: hypothetical protein KC486_16175 [Myxococcales bacterium]|nr:hypothetical protein [Myxococcales bacterium]
MTHDELIALAPAELDVRRTSRFDGTGHSVALSRFVQSDQELIRKTYAVVKRAYGLWLHIRDAAHLSDKHHEALLHEHILTELRDRNFLLTLRDLGAATYKLGTPPREVRAALHDIRGGALLALIGYAAAEGRGDAISSAELHSVILRARDHARIMRNAITDLDPTLRAIDAGVKTHTMLDFIDKWANTTYRIGERAIKVSTALEYDGFVSHYDLETAALDRVLYNHVNNAARFTADDRVEIAALPVNERLVRWVISNPLYPEHNVQLSEQVGGDLSKLYRGGLTRGGHGIGLNNCAALVADAVGVDDIDALLSRGYVGAEIRDHHYVAWFHWPICDAPEDEAIAAS